MKFIDAMGLVYLIIYVVLYAYAWWHRDKPFWHGFLYPFGEPRA